MSDTVKPISGKETVPATKPAQPETVKIGNVEFRRDQIQEDKTKTYTENGKKMNSVWLKPGVQIVYPDQTETAHVESIGLRKEWYNPDDSNIHIYDLRDAKIYGNPNKTDYITLEGNSSGNEIFVNQKESWYINGEMRQDRVELGCNTSDNKVHMDEKDRTTIFYNQMEVTMNGHIVQDNLEYLDVQGEGESAQEPQLRNSLGDDKYKLHKHLQQNK